MKNFSKKIRTYGSVYYVDEDGLYHRTDGPAVKYSNGNNYWWIHGELHREDGPAVELNTGINEWWLNGQELTEEEHIRHVTKLGKALYL